MTCFLAPLPSVPRGKVAHEVVGLYLFEAYVSFQLKFLNEYHARVLATIGPILQQRNLLEDYDWLAKECAPLTRAATADAAVSAFVTPMLIVASVISAFWM
ncbi:hypothetical protein NE865_08169 [Phthorimaea operculella]|nr:hypothetical protein NE865_08169 [Phthorimaea operculella]